MNLHHQDNTTKVIHGDCIETMNAMPPASVDAIVTDPPYGLGFMGKKWDGLPPSLEWAEACYRVLKPGGHIAAFGGTRTWHRLAVAIEDAGFEMRDSLAWLYGSGFPKSLDVSKAIDKQRDDYPAIREVVMFIREAFAASGADRAQLDEALGGSAVMAHFLAPSRSNAHCPTWDQWQTLKAILCFDDSMDAEVWRLNGRKGKPGDAWQNAEVVGIREGAMAGWSMDGSTKYVTREDKSPATPDAKRWQGWGTALKPAFEPIVLARKPLAAKTVARNVLEHGTGAINIDACRINGRSGRWPANVLLDHNAATWVDEQTPHLGRAVTVNSGRKDGEWSGNQIYGRRNNVKGEDQSYGDQGGASRFFKVAESDENGAISPYFPREFDDAFLYAAKAPKRERPNVNGVQHPTVKPLAIMQWLIRLVTPPNGTVLDPFAGSGTTLEAARNAGFSSIGIEAEETYLPLIDQRLQRSNTNPIELEGIGE